MCFHCYNISPFLFTSRTTLMLLWPWVSQGPSYMNGWPDIRELTLFEAPELTFRFSPIFSLCLFLFWFVLPLDLCWSSLVYLSFVLLFCFTVYLITSWYLLAKIENNNSKQPTFRQQELPPKQEVKQCVINYKCKKTFKVLSYHIIPAYEFDLMY